MNHQRNSPPSDFEIALQYHRAGRLAEAEAIYERMPDDPDALHLRGLIAEQLNNYEKAIDLIKKSISLNPSNAQYYFSIEIAYRAMNRLDEVAAAYLKLVAHLPNQANVQEKLGSALRDLGNMTDAIACYENALALDPNFAEAYGNMGVALKLQGRLDEAVASYQKAIALRPDFAEVHSNLGNAFREQGKLDMAAACYENALTLKPELAETQLALGNSLREQGKLEEAAARYQNVLALEPNHAVAYNNLASVLAAQGKLDEAARCYRNMLALRPDLYEVHYNLGIVLKDLGELNEAVACNQQALSLKPDFFEGYNNLGITLAALGKLDEAAACYLKSLELQPGFAAAYTNLGNVLQEQGKLDDAVACHQKALELQPDFAVAYTNLGHTLKQLGKLDEATLCYQQAVALRPNDAAGQINLGNRFRDQRKLNEAMACYLNALALKPDSAEALNNLGLVFADQDNSDEAIAFYKTALKIKPDFAEAYNNLGIQLQERGDLDEAMACFEKAIAIKPDYPSAHANQGRAFHRQGRPDEAIDCYHRALELQADDKDTHHSLLLAMQYSAIHTPEELFAAHVRFGEQFETALKPYWAPHPNLRAPDKRLKIGYVSPDFCKHPVAYSMEPVLARHDKSRFEVYCYYNRDYYDPVTERIKAMADHWVPCKHLSDEQLAEQIRADGIDILIDLASHTGDNRLLAFARKPAPVQVTYLGYPCTTGLTAIDYRITDVYAEPPGMTEQFNVEQLWRLPEIFCCYRAHDNSPDVIDHPPAEDNGYVTFGCFNNFSKVTDPVVALWAKVLEKVPAARLMLEIHGIENPSLRTEIEQRLSQLGIPLERLILEPRKPSNQYVLYNRIDIALDPFPCNGGTTSFDTMWMGVPLITLAGRHFTSRLGVTILSNAGLPELIAQSEDEYVDIAAALANDLPRLKTTRAGLRERVQAGPLMDAQRFTSHLEQAYRGMWRKWCEQ